MYSNRDLLAKTLQAEAGNQGLGGMMAIGSVIANRLGQGQSWRDVILAPGQFSAWNKVTGYAGGEQGQDMTALEPSADAYAAADAILSGDFVDVTGGATHYYNPEISQPNWGASAGGDWQQIGAHLFGKAGAFKTGASDMDGQQPTAQQMQQMQRRGGLMGFLQDPRTREVLSSFSRSRVGERLGEIAARDREAMRGRESDNKTAQWLSTQKGGQPFAQAIMEGAMTGSQAYEAWLKQTQRSGTKIGDRLVDPVTGEVIYEDETLDGQLDKEQVGVVSQLNGQLRQTYKLYDEVFNGYNLIKSAIQRRQEGDVTSGIDDLTITIAFAKILDPESVVRSEESAAVSRAGGGIQAAINAFRNFLDGAGTLSDPVRQRIFTVANDTAKTWFDKSQEEYERIKKTAKLYGISDEIAEQVFAKPRALTVTPLPAEGGDGDKPIPEVIPQSAKDAGLEQPDWDRMNDDEKLPFLE
jgi:hypothetical protein